MKVSEVTGVISVSRDGGGDTLGTTDAVVCVGRSRLMEVTDGVDRSDARKHQ